MATTRIEPWYYLHELGFFSIKLKPKCIGFFPTLHNFWHGSYTPGPTLWNRNWWGGINTPNSLATNTHTYTHLWCNSFYFSPIKLELRSKWSPTGQWRRVWDPHTWDKTVRARLKHGNPKPHFWANLLQPSLPLLLLVDLVRTKYLVSLKGPTSYNSFLRILFPILPNPGPGRKRKW